MNAYEKEIGSKKEEMRKKLQEIATHEELAMMYDYAIERSTYIHETRVEDRTEYWVMLCTPNVWLTYSKHESIEEAVRALIQRIHAKIASGDWERTPRTIGDSSLIVDMKEE